MVMSLLAPFLVSGLASGVRAATKGKGGVGDKKRRRRRRRLTQSDLTELASVKATLGKTAAANALPFYLGRR